MTNQELNEAVARKLGWKELGGRWSSPGLTGWKNIECPAYSTSIEAAWEIVERMEYMTLRHRYGLGLKGFVCQVDRNGQMVANEEADTAPMAICKAFLKLETP